MFVRGLNTPGRNTDISSSSAASFDWNAAFYENGVVSLKKKLLLACVNYRILGV
jgi:hypothetical protein